MAAVSFRRSRRRNFKSAGLYRLGIRIAVLLLFHVDDCTRFLDTFSDTGAINATDSQTPAYSRDPAAIIRPSRATAAFCKFGDLFRFRVSRAEQLRRPALDRGHATMRIINGASLSCARRRKSRAQPSFVSFFGCART